MYSRKMMGVCLRYIGDRETARDLLQDGFIKERNIMQQWIKMFDKSVLEAAERMLWREDIRFCCFHSLQQCSKYWKKD